MYVLGVETSCDETGVGIVEGKRLIINETYSQIVHKEYGGVVPELAAREHIARIYTVARRAFEKSGMTPSDINAIACTRGPGLIGSLMVGSLFARALAQSLNKPFVSVNHLHAHLLTPLFADPDFEFPYLCLLASGGHTILAVVWEPLKIEVLGKTLDDAAGEAFDKAGVLLGLPYPAGPLIDKIAKGGDPSRYRIRQPNVKGFNFSFSGIKTAFLHIVNDLRRKGGNELVGSERAHLAAAVQSAIVEHLISRLRKAIKIYKPRRVAIVGGVAANSCFRARAQELAERYSLKYVAPPPQLCTDNGAMIALAGYFKLIAGRRSSITESPRARLPLDEFI